MENRENKLRSYRLEIDQNFIHGFAGISDINYYVKVSLPQKWLDTYGNHSVKKINVSDYEETLIQFLKRPETISSSHPLLIIVGGAGTGKSSSIQYALKRANIFEQYTSNFHDKNYPTLIHLDFLNFRQEAEVTGYDRNEEAVLVEESKNFWSYIAERLNSIIDKNLKITEEVSSFWLWLLTQEIKGRHGSLFNQFLESIIHLIQDPVKNSVELFKYRTELIKGLTREEFAYYKLYQIAYLKRYDTLNRNLLIFDNIDRLQPKFQVDLINFAIETNRTLKCKAIIPMRPHTFHLNKDASDCIEIIEHCVPNLVDVFDLRLKKFKEKGDNDVYFSMKKIIETIHSNPTIKEVFHSSSGASTRFALRNLYNLFLAPSIITHENNQLLKQVEFDSKIFFPAFFCSESSKEKLHEANFVNILTLKNVKNVYNYSNIKLRTLYYLYTNSEVETRDLVSLLESFGYSINDIVSVINEFLDDKKSLMWSNVYSEYDVNSVRINKNHKFYITPMGTAYFEKIITYPSYLSECVYALEDDRRKYLSSSMSRLSEVVKLLFDKDIEEVNKFCSIHNVSEYREMFTSESPCISSVLFFKMQSNFERITRNIVIEEFDSYGYYIVKEMNTMLNSLDS